MKKFEVSADSTCDLYAQEIKQMGIEVEPVSFVLTKDDELIDEKDAFISFEEYENFYQKLANGYIAKTSVLNVQSHVDLFTRCAKKGIKKLLHICISYGLSPFLDNANKAIEIVKKDFPGIEYVAIDANTTTCTEGFIVKAAVKLRDEGKSLQEAAEIITGLRNKTQHFILANDLKFLARGGRISAAAASIGSLFQVKPVICFNKQGKLQIVRKEIGLKKAMISVVNEFKSFTLNKDFPYVTIVHTGNITAAKEMQQMFKQKYGLEVEIRYMGPIISAHVGPNGVAYTFVSNEERPF